MADYQTKCSILAELWEGYKDNKDFKEFIQYNDLGLPLAYFLSEGLISEITEPGQLYVNETFDLLISGMGIEEQEIPEGMSLVGLLSMAEERQKK